MQKTTALSYKTLSKVTIGITVKLHSIRLWFILGKLIIYNSVQHSTDAVHTFISQVLHVLKEMIPNLERCIFFLMEQDGNTKTTKTLLTFVITQMIL